MDLLTNLRNIKLKALTRPIDCLVQYMQRSKKKKSLKRLIFVKQDTNEYKYLYNCLTSKIYAEQPRMVYSLNVEHPISKQDPGQQLPIHMEKPSLLSIFQWQP